MTERVLIIMNSKHLARLALVQGSCLSISKSWVVIVLMGLILGGCAANIPTHSDFTIGMSQDHVSREFGKPSNVEYIFSKNPSDYISEPVTGEPAPQEIEVWSYKSTIGASPQVTSSGDSAGTSLLYFFRKRLTRTEWVAGNGSANDS